ncbi:MAG: hypothetical protein O6946_10775 [Gammaproteobacteria bacterium]|nr:hypothetical protein [Gammaproteobacteria bacterium]
MIFATKTEFLSLSVSRLALAVFFLLLPAYAHAQDEPRADPVTTEVVDSVDQAPVEVKVFAESIQSTPQTPPDPVLDSSPAADQAASNSDDEEDGIVVSSIPQPENLATDELIDESQKMAVGERYPEALEYALFAVEQEDSPEDPYNPALIGPVMNLADIQEKLQLDREAAESIERAIDLIERDGGIYDARLVDAINDAGRLLQKSGEHERAIGSFHRSQHISHRVDGVYSPDQVSALELMTRSYLSMGNLDKANSAQNFRYVVDLHQFGRGSILSVPSMVKLARFKSGLRLYDNARQLYKEAIQITDESLGENDLSLVPLLLGLASVRQDQRALRDYHSARHEQQQQDLLLLRYDRRPQLTLESAVSERKPVAPARVQGATHREALEALSRAIQIVDDNQDKVSVAHRVAIYVRLGDLYMTKRKKNSGIATYRQALKLLDSESDEQELKERYFGRPRRLQYKKPRPVPNGAGRYTNYDGTFAEASFVVLANGSVDDVEVVASNAPVPMRTLFRKEVRRSIYRPRFVDGEPVATTEHLREEFAGTALPANATPAGD